MKFTPDHLQEYLTDNYGFTLVLKASGKPHNKKVHRLTHSHVEPLLHIQVEDFTQANVALPYIPEYVDKITDCLKINGVSDARESNRSCFLGYPENVTGQKKALCFTIEHKDAVAPFIELMFGLKAI
ncbi:hypothetical protein OHW55_17890 [Acinetobacter baumannii]|nr:hypothetical protein [Acinetobacter baumannii]